MVLAQRQKYRSMEQNRKPRDKYTYLQTPHVQQGRQEYTIPLKFVSKRKNLGINLIKDMKDLHAGKYKILTNEIEDDSKKWKDTLSS